MGGFKFRVGKNGNQNPEVFCNVLGNGSTEGLYCACMKFESIGILYSHALKVLQWMEIIVVPDKYMLLRSRRDTKDSWQPSTDFHIYEHDLALVIGARFRTIYPMMVQLAARASSYSEEAYDCLANGLSDLCRGFNKIIISHFQNVKGESDQDSDNHGQGLLTQTVSLQEVLSKGAPEENLESGIGHDTKGKIKIKDTERLARVRAFNRLLKCQLGCKVCSHNYRLKMGFNH